MKKTIVLIVSAGLGLVMLIAYVFAMRQDNVVRSGRSDVILSFKDVSYESDVAKLEEYWKHIHAGNRYFNDGRYDLAEEEMGIAINTSRSHGDVWMARRLRVRIYEKQAKYDLAVNEIDWLIDNNRNRADIVHELSLEKQRIMSLPQYNEQRPRNSRT